MDERDAVPLERERERERDKRSDTAARKWIAEHRSCTKPGSVSSAERRPPDRVVGLEHQTAMPSCSRRIPAAGRLGLEPDHEGVGRHAARANNARGCGSSLWKDRCRAGHPTRQRSRVARLADRRRWRRSAAASRRRRRNLRGRVDRGGRRRRRKCAAASGRRRRRRRRCAGAKREPRGQRCADTRHRCTRRRRGSASRRRADARSGGAWRRNLRGRVDRAWRRNLRGRVDRERLLTAQDGTARSRTFWSRDSDRAILGAGGHHGRERRL